jgi:hypothetical protein
VRFVSVKFSEVAPAAVREHPRPVVPAVCGQL